MDAFDSSSDDDTPSFSKKQQGKDNKTPTKTSYIPEQKLWKVLTDIEMAALCADSDSKDPPSDYKIGVYISERLKAMEEEGTITSVKDARSVMECAERLCIKYMRAMLEPAVIKKLIGSAFPSRDLKAILEKIKSQCPDEMEQYNMRLALRKNILTTNNISSTPPVTPEKSPARSNSTSSFESPTKTENKGRRESPKRTPPRTPKQDDDDDIVVVLPKTIHKFDMSKIKDANALVGQEVPFERSKWHAYSGYQVYAENGSRLYLHKSSIEFLKAHWSGSDLPKLIQGKVTAIKTEKAAASNRYELNEGDAFGIATIQFTTKKK